MPEVMRGEETQIFGAISMEPSLQNAIHQGMPVLIGLPGTHAKWAVVENNTITDFRTFMTGELFDVLSRHSILGATMHPRDELHWDAFHPRADSSTRASSDRIIIDAVFDPFAPADQ